MTPGQRHDAYERPIGVAGDTVAAVGKVTEASESVQRARGPLYDLHQMVGHANHDDSQESGVLTRIGAKQAN